MFDETLKNLKEIQKTRDLESFFGWKEDQFFEAKESRGYNLDEQKDRVDFTKDVSAFANSQGGILVVGLATGQPNPEEKIDVVTKLDLIVLSTFQKEKFEGIIRDNIQGKIADLQVETIESKDQPGNGIVFVVVPPQDEDEKPFLMKQWFEGEQKISQIAFGYAQRNLSNNDPTPIHQLREWIKNGKSPGIQTMLRIEGKLDSIIFHRNIEETEKTSPKSKLADRIQDILEEK